MHEVRRRNICLLRLFQQQHHDSSSRLRAYVHVLRTCAWAKVSVIGLEEEEEEEKEEKEEEGGRRRRRPSSLRVFQGGQFSPSKPTKV
jgi:hypothetical protein